MFKRLTVILCIIAGGIPALYWGAMSGFGLIIFVIGTGSDILYSDFHLFDLKSLIFLTYFSGGVIGCIGIWWAILADANELPLTNRKILLFMLAVGICTASLPLFALLSDFNSFLHSKDQNFKLMGLSILGMVAVGLRYMIKFFPALRKMAGH